ncbi:shikimate dehydrogenase family protein [Arthrobacter rhombi]|uniref:shikimate dehydrogenase family protein n=1 Tax=Arthrobacter rhombi TaxID=71253 RepID=UPI003FD51390
MSDRQRAAVFGQPIAHSKSPALHLAAYGQLRVPLDYQRVEAGTGQARDLTTRLRVEPGWKGASVTMPLKQVMVPLMDSVSERVQRLGVLNTIVVSSTPGGIQLRGENTDVDGIIRALAEAGARTVETVAVLGAGGTAAAATEALRSMGATTVDYVVRNAGRAAETIELAETLGCTATAIDVAAAGQQLNRYDAVVSTLPPRAADALIADLQLQNLRPGTALLDVAYDPWPSALATAWEAAGGTVIGGLSMLLHQAVEQVKMFSGVTEADWGQVTNVMCDAVGLPHPRT